MAAPSLTLDLDSGVPVYRQIIEEVRLLVARGALRDGDELPSVRRLGAQIGVNLNTVAKAYRVLADEGLVELRHGSGARVRVADAPYRQAVPIDDERRLQELIGRWVLGGATRPVVLRRLENAVEHFFKKPHAEEGT